MKARRISHQSRGLQRTLVTPEGITLSIEIASRGSRVAALFLDFLFIGLLMIVTTVGLFAAVGGAASVDKLAKDDTAAGYAVQFLFIVWLISMFLFRNAYFLFFELGARGATPGKRLNGIRIAARDGGRLTAEMVIARNLLRDIELFLPLVFLASVGVESGLGWFTATAWFLIFLLFPVFNRDALRAGDVIAGSWVVQAPRPKLASAMSIAQAPDKKSPRGDEDTVVPAAADTAPRYRFTDEQLAVYGEFELQSLERVLRDKRSKAIEPVYMTISEKIGRNDGWNDERIWLEAYYTQLRARLEAGMRMGVRKADKHTEA